MSNRKIIALVIAALVVGVVFFFYNKQAKEEEAVRSLVYGYGPEVLINEGGYTAARNYADSIFTEMYCNQEEIVYQYAFTENCIDIPHRRLDAVIYRGTANENHLYFYYSIPNIRFENVDGKPDKSVWEYTETYTYAAIDMRNIAHNDTRVFQCNDFSVITKDVDQTIYECMDKNAERIPADDIQRKMIDYGVLYNCNENIGSYLADLEKERIGGFLLAKQIENAAEYSLTTTSDNEVVSTPASLTDHSATIGGQTGTRPTPTPVTPVHQGIDPSEKPVITPTITEQPIEQEATPTPTPRVKPDRERPATHVVTKDSEDEDTEKEK